MRHTLIPPAERLAIHREYHTRAAVVLLCGLGVAIVVGMGALFPAYLSARIADKAAKDSLAFMRSNKDDSGLTRIEQSLVADNALVGVLDAGDMPRFSDAVRSIVRTRSAVRLSSFNMSRQGTSTVETVVRGVAPTRADLLSFKDRLEALVPGAAVDLPLEELKKSTDIQFSLRFTAHL